MRKMGFLWTCVGLMVGVMLIWWGQAAAEPAGGATVTVDVFSNGYAPNPVAIAPGDAVEWQNTGGIHNVVSDDGLFSSGAASSDPWSYTFTFDDPGYYQYHCTVHGGPGGQGMSGAVLVGDDRYLPAVRTDDGGDPGPTPGPPAGG